MIAVRDLQFSYGSDFVLNIPRLDVASGERAAIIGPSGVGKTTLVSLIAGILQPGAGAIHLDDTDLTRLSDRERRDFRIRNIGFVFQEFELLEYLSVRDNILLPFRVNSAMRITDHVHQHVIDLTRRMGIEKYLRRYPNTLSQGEKQRVAICRALATDPQLLIADEPTGNLDPRTSDTILQLLLEEAQRRNATLLMVTHNHTLLRAFERTIDLNDFVRLNNSPALDEHAA